jgi:hypothetical protein
MNYPSLNAVAGSPWAPTDRSAGEQLSGDGSALDRHNYDPAVIVFLWQWGDRFWEGTLKWLSETEW